MWQSYTKIFTYILKEFAIFIFDAYYINVCVKFDDFFQTARVRKSPIHVPIVQKMHHLEHAQYAFLNHSKTLVFSDFIEIEILFK